MPPKEEVPVLPLKRPSLFSPEGSPPPRRGDAVVPHSPPSSPLSTRTRNYSTGSEPELRPVMKKIDQVGFFGVFSGFRCFWLVRFCLNGCFDNMFSIVLRFLYFLTFVWLCELVYKMYNFENYEITQYIYNFLVIWKCVVSFVYVFLTIDSNPFADHSCYSFVFLIINKPVCFFYLIYLKFLLTWYWSIYFILW